MVLAARDGSPAGAVGAWRGRRITRLRYAAYLVGSLPFLAVVYGATAGRRRYRGFPWRCRSRIYRHRWMACASCT